jgi:hypothetical protein
VRVLKAISGFQSRESYRQPVALMEACAKSAGWKVTLASASGPQYPAARLPPSAGFFYLTLASANRAAATIGPPSPKNRKARKNHDVELKGNDGQRRGRIRQTVEV